jgi:hypothetical protein
MLLSGKPPFGRLDRQEILPLTFVISRPDPGRKLRADARQTSLIIAEGLSSLLIRRGGYGSPLCVRF